VALVLAIANSTAACGDGDDASTGATTTATTTDSESLTFYTPSTALSSGAPGDVLSKEPIALDPSMHGTGWRVTFVSTTPAGDRVPVTGVLIQPRSTKPAKGYPVVVWAHGTTGLGDQCAPSAYEPFALSGVAPLIDAGYVIAAPDYEGLGIPDEIHPYLVGEASGHNVLDAARAARTIGGSNVVLAWGWSQGGHAALFARSLQPVYAPELDFRGAAAQAPVTDVDTFLLPGRTDVDIFPFTAETILAWAEVYEETSLLDLVVVEDAEKARLAQQACTGDIADNTTRPLDDIFRSDPENTAAWREAVRINSVVVGESDIPVLLTHGAADIVVPVAGTNALYEQLCAAQVATVYMHDPAWNHFTAYYTTLSQVDAWLAARIAGDPAPTDCTSGK